MNFVLIHGGWQGGWCWDGVVAELERQGATAFAPTLPGSEPEETTDRSGARFARSIVAVTDFVVSNDLHDVVLVGHSGGGPVGQGVVEAVPERVSRLVIVDGWVLRDGESVHDVVNQEAADFFRAVAAATPDQMVPLSEEFWLNSMCNDMSEEQARGWLDRIVPIPLAMLEERFSLPTFSTLDIRSGYVFLEDDIAVDRSIYEGMAARLKGPVTTTCPGSHEAMLSQPVALAEALLRVAS